MAECPNCETTAETRLLTGYLCENTECSVYTFTTEEWP